MDYQLTQHAREELEQRGIQLEWVERALFTPEWAESDAIDAIGPLRYLKKMGEVQTSGG